MTNDLTHAGRVQEDLIVEIRELRTENERLIDKIFQMYHAAGMIEGGDELEAVKRLRTERDKLAADLTQRDAEIERLRLRLLTAAGDDLCRLTPDEIKELSRGAVKIPPKEEFIASCERFHSQIANTSGVLPDCLTLAQMIAENELQRAEIERLKSPRSEEWHLPPFDSPEKLPDVGFVFEYWFYSERKNDLRMRHFDRFDTDKEHIEDWGGVDRWRYAVAPSPVPGEVDRLRGVMQKRAQEIDSLLYNHRNGLSPFAVDRLSAIRDKLQSAAAAEVPPASEREQLEYLPNGDIPATADNIMKATRNAVRELKSDVPPASEPEMPPDDLGGPPTFADAESLREFQDSEAKPYNETPVAPDEMIEERVDAALAECGRWIIGYTEIIRESLLQELSGLTLPAATHEAGQMEMRERCVETVAVLIGSELPGGVTNQRFSDGALRIAVERIRALPIATAAAPTQEQPAERPREWHPMTISNADLYIHDFAQNTDEVKKEDAPKAADDKKPVEETQKSNYVPDDRPVCSYNSAAQPG